MNWGLRFAVVAVSAALALGGCGKDDAFVNPGTPPGGGGGGGGGAPPDDTTPAVESLLLLVDPPVLSSGAIDNPDGVTVTAIARSADNVVLPDVTINFSTDSGALAVPNPVTNANGRVTATLTTGGDPRNRTITVTAAADQAASSVTVQVSGTQFQIDGPTSIEAGESDTYTVRLRDSAGRGLRDVTISASSASGNLITPASAVTDTQGRATFDITGNVGGTDTVTFQGLDMSTTRSVLVSPYGFVFLQPTAGTEVNLGTPVTVQVELRRDGSPLAGQTINFSATRGTLSTTSATTGGDGRASVTLTSSGANGAGPALVTALGPDNVSRKHFFEFVATTPSTITTQVEPGTVAPEGEATVISVVRDANSNPVKNQVVRFSLNDTSGGQLTSSTAITDAQGVARTTYRASSAGSAQNGVTITAEVGSPVVATDDANLTVAAPTLFIVLGTDNLVVKNNATATYDKTFNALILDSAGNPPPPGTQFRLSIRSLEYQKGQFSRASASDVWSIDSNDLVPSSDPFYGGMSPYFGMGPFGCQTEDPQGTGNINLANDYNNNGQIDPANVALVPATAEINADGVAAFTIRWPQNYAIWVLARLTATAVVAGTESVRRLDFVLPMVTADTAANTTPPNVVSPWGTVRDCTSSN